MTRKTLAREAQIYVLTAVQLIFGFVAGLLLLGLIPGDRVNFNVIGSLVLMIPTAGLAYLANRRLKAINA